MRTVVIYKEYSDHAREINDYMRDFERQTNKKIEEINPDTREGADFCRAYDVVEYPTIMALDDSGSMLSMWRGKPLPRIDEVSYYAR